MATDDSLAGETNAEDGSRGGEGGEGEATQQGGSGGLDHEAFKGMMTETLGPAFEQIGQVLGSVDQRLSGLESSKPSGNDTTGGGGSDDELQELLKEPVQKIVAEESRKTYGTLMGPMVADRRSAYTAEAKTAIDEEYGDGTWDEVFEDEVKGILDGFPPEGQMRKTGVQAAVAQVVGQHAKDLFGKFQENTKKREAATTDYRRLPPGREQPTQRGLSPDEQLLVKSMQDAGVEDVDEKSYAAAKAGGTTLAAWRASRKGGGANAG